MSDMAKSSVFHTFVALDNFGCRMTATLGRGYWSQCLRQCYADGAAAAAIKVPGNAAAFPNRQAQILLTHDPLAVANQIGQQLEDARLDGYDLGPPPQFVPGVVEHIVFEQKSQLRPNAISADT
jgi:hypothetical protein